MLGNEVMARVRRGFLNLLPSFWYCLKEIIVRLLIRPDASEILLSNSERRESTTRKKNRNEKCKIGYGSSKHLLPFARVGFACILQCYLSLSHV